MATVEGCQDHVGSQHNPNEDSDDLESHESTNGSDQEGQPLLHEPGQEDWRPPPAFVAIQIAIMSNVFLYGFDSTITASTYAVISSEFDAANTASWLTTSYLVTSTAFQPLYGRVSDIFGRRICFFISTITFALGCLGCGIARNVVFLNIMRALTGFGGGGLMTMATIVNSDIIPFRRRGMYQAMQNGIVGFGMILGASSGGTIADQVGWRWCFLLQVPLSAVALIIGYKYVKNQPGMTNLTDARFGTIWRRVDFRGAILLVVSVSMQLIGMSLGGNQLPWLSAGVIGSLLGSLVLFTGFLYVEARTSAIPIIPLKMLRGRLPIATQVANVCAGLAAYAFLFMIPLYFQVVLLESATKAGARLAIPSLAVPLGGLLAGIVMSRWGRLLSLVRTGSVLMMLGNGILASLAFKDAEWKYHAYIFPASFGQGIINPAILFTSLASFDHADHAVSASTVYLIRSLGTVWGVSISSAIVQSTLTRRLPKVLGDVPDKWTIINSVRHSVEALRDLPPDTQLKAQLVYYEGINNAFIATTGLAAVGVVAAFCTNAANLRKTH